MFPRPLLLLTIVMSALLCGAQMNPFDSSASNLGIRAILSGAVRDASDRPINGARIEVIDQASGRTVASTFSSANGSFEIDNIRHGEYEIVARCGIAETRTLVQMDSDRDVSFRLSLASSVPADQSNVSLSQMKVPGKARRMFEKAEEAFHKARIDEAFSFVQKALGMYPDYAKALTLRGILHMQKGENKDAQPDLEKAVQLDYGDDMGFVALASFYNNEGQFDQAQQTLDHGITLNPKSWQANMEMARAYMGKKDYPAALKSLDRAQTFAPPTVSLPHLFRAQALIGLKDYNAAIKELETFVSQTPDGNTSDQARSTLSKLKEYTASAQK